MGHCYVLVHVGSTMRIEDMRDFKRYGHDFSDPEMLNLFPAFHLGKDVYYGRVSEGPIGVGYRRYISNCMRLMDRLRSEDEPRVFVIEKGIFLKEEKVFRPVAPKYPERILLTGLLRDKDDPSSFLHPKIDTDYVGYMDPETVFDDLRGEGVDEVRLAGEYTGHMLRARGCLGELAAMFDGQGFRIRGVEGCMFPDASKSKDEILRKLYSA